MDGLAMTKKPPTEQYFAPWRDVQPDGALGPEHGPKTLTTFQKHLKRHGDWAWQYARATPEIRMLANEEYRRFMRLADGTLRTGIPDGEVAAYRLVCEQHMGQREAAKAMKVTRRTVRSYLLRLGGRVSEAVNRE